MPRCRSVQHLPFLNELALIAGLGALVSVVLSRLRLPTVTGLLLSGALAGPFGLHLVSDSVNIEALAEIGVVFLLFTVGLEFPLSKLRAILRQVALGGVLQVGLTVATVAGAAVAFGEPVRRAIFFGFVFSLSSTAIVFRGLSERRELDAPHGRFIVGANIFQDLCIVPMVLIVPVLAQGDDASVGAALGWAALKAVAVVVAALFAARFVVPFALAWVDKSRSREVFLLSVLGLCLGGAWLTSTAGLSLALGAFLGGLMVADTDYGHRAMGDLLPLRDAFVSIFFVSLGMLFNARAVVDNPGLVALLLAGFLVAKGALATVSALAMRFPVRVAWLAGVGLAQFGEFGFVLTQLGESSKLVTRAEMSPLLAAGILSMFLTPLLVRMAPHVTAGERLLGPLARLLGVRTIDEVTPDQALKLSGHVVIVGFGVAGRLVAKALSSSGVSYVVLELNADAVRAARSTGEHIFYADATSEEALHHAHLERARALVLLMNDPQAAARVVSTAKRVAPNLPLLMRARYLLEKPTLVAQGATDVVAEEVEGAVEMIARVLRSLDVPRNDIDSRIRDARHSTQTTERKLTLPRKSLSDMPALAGLKVESLRLPSGSHAVGKSPHSLDLRVATGALVVAIGRAGNLLQNLTPTEVFEADDVVYLVGTGEAIRSAQEALLRASA